jgi:uncharacterized protein (TIGR02186 family)
MRALDLPCVLTVMAGAALVSSSVVAQPVVMDLSTHTVAITANFDGSDILLFGGTQGESDVIAIIRGPQSPRIVRRKERRMGIWVNGDAIEFDEVPSFYAVAATRPPAELLSAALLESYAIGVENLTLMVRWRDADLAGGSQMTAPDESIVQTFRAGLVRNMRRLELYSADVAPIKILGDALFRVDLHFPTNVPIGAYDVRILLIRDGEVVSTGTTHMKVRKSGIEASIYDFAHRYPPAYGLVAILIAVAAGWLAAAAFRKA